MKQVLKVGLQFNESRFYGFKGYEGDGVSDCVKVKTPLNLTICENDTDCVDSEACINGKCQSPCMGTCGNAAECISMLRLESLFKMQWI